MTATTVHYVEGQLGDPESFLRDNPELVQGVPDGQPAIVSGFDWDVLVRKGTPGVEARRHEGYPAPVLGALYRSAMIYNLRYGDDALNLEYFPSPYYVNNSIYPLLGIEPGVDAFSFAHAPEEDKIDPHEFSNFFLERYEYPQSLGQSLFDHDRSILGHPLGIIVMPPVITREIMQNGVKPEVVTRVQAAYPEHLGIKEFALPDALDAVSSIVSTAARPPYNALHYSPNFEWLRPLIPVVERLSEESGERAHISLIKLVRARVTELAPRIALAQAQIEPLPLAASA